MALLELENVSFTAGGEVIIKDINLKVNEKDYISIVGPSGSGKSTLLKICSHLISPSEGHCILKIKIFLSTILLN